MDDVLPRPTADAQKELLERIRRGASENDKEENEIPEEVESELDL
jgi:hypothetical protein